MAIKRISHRIIARCRVVHVVLVAAIGTGRGALPVVG